MAAYSVVLGCLMALLLLLYKISSAARYYLKFVYFIITSGAFATLPIPLMLRKPRSSENALIPAYLCRLNARYMGLTWEVRGTEHIDNTRGNIVILNHQSLMDLVCLAIIWPLMKNSTVISKRIIFYWWPFGLATWLWGTVFIDRTQHQEAKATVNKTVQAINARKAKILMFAEGTRNTTERLLPFKKGAFHAALDAACPLQPVVISKYHFLDHKRHIFGPGHFIVEILPLVSTDGLTKEDLPKLIESTQTLMQEKFTQLSTESMALNSMTCQTAASKSMSSQKQKVDNNNCQSYKQRN